MATTSARKKLDEKHMKVLRELAALPSNKHCFDCHQRGPTYVNVTIGSFVCTKCSGILRGLTPPHRVKSISMATFTQEEVDLLNAKGNQHCQSVWLGLCENEPPLKDEQQIKDFMINKYEKKRYYVEGGNGKGGLTNGLSSRRSPAASVPTPMARPPSTPAHLQMKSSLMNGGGAKASVTMTNEKEVKVAEGSTSVDPFAPLPTAAAPTQQSFANFDNNPIFTASPIGTGAVMSPKGSSVSPSVNHAAPSEDRYAALKDLDCLMKAQQQEPAVQPTDVPTPSEGSNCTTAWNSSSTISSLDNNSKGINPFSNGWSSGPALSASSMFGTNPFKELKSEWSNSSSTNGFSNVVPPNGFSGNGHQISQSFSSNLFWPPNSTSIPLSKTVSNPFTQVVGGGGVNGGRAVAGGFSGVSTGSYHSSNPFL